MPVALPPLAQSALLLDLDGTLLDLAPTPEAVIVPPALVYALARLRALLGGALAIISGRPVEQVDALLPGIPYAVAGEHGGSYRQSPRAPLMRPDLPALPPPWYENAVRAVALESGALLERKARGLVFHFRQVPAAGLRLEAAARAIVGIDHRFEVMPAAMAWEIRPCGADKGSALRQIMQNSPFEGRTPLFIGDDVTDWEAIRTANAMGGAGLLVGTHFTAGPSAVRDWLQRSAEHGAWANLPN